MKGKAIFNPLVTMYKYGADKTAPLAKDRVAGIINDNESETTRKDNTATTTTKVDETVNATDVGEAAKTAGSESAGSDGVLDFSMFGVKIDTDAMSGAVRFESQEEEKACARRMVDDAIRRNGINTNPAANPIFGNQPMNQGAPMQGASQQPVVGRGRHKVDNPTQQKPKPPKAEADNVEFTPGVLNIEVEPPKPPKTWPDPTNNVLENAEPIPETAQSFDNSAVIAQFNQCAGLLRDIEKIASEVGVHVQMISKPGSNGQPSGLIECYVYTGQPTPNPFKGFTIDTGAIIDRRVKIFPAIVEAGYEDLPAYPVMISRDGKEESDNKKKVVDAKLIKTLLVGGAQMLTPSSMYTKDYMELNKHVAIITMPTSHMNSETRKAVRDRLLNAMRSGLFEEAAKIDQFARFRFVPKSYNKQTLEFELSSQGVPYRFCGPCMSKKNITIKFGKDGKATMSHE